MPYHSVLGSSRFPGYRRGCPRTVRGWTPHRQSDRSFNKALDEVLARVPARGVSSGPGGIRTCKTMYSEPAVECVLVPTKVLPEKSLRVCQFHHGAAGRRRDSKAQDPAVTGPDGLQHSVGMFSIAETNDRLLFLFPRFLLPPLRSGQRLPDRPGTIRIESDQLPLPRVNRGD